MIKATEENKNFFLQLKLKSEKLWSSKVINPKIYGFQIQKRTRWRPGIKLEEIKLYESEIGFEFPQIYKDFLMTMNGTDTPTVNVYGESGTPYVYGPGYYSYPQDLELVKDRIEWICESFKIKKEEMDGVQIPFILPIVSHRFLIIPNKIKFPVLSMHGNDVIIYSSSLKEFLIDDIFNDHARSKNLEEISVNFWLK